VVYGLTLNNNPTIQDLWNTTPGWGFPFIGSEAAPAPAASTMIDGGLSQNVLGLGTYALFGDLIYAEFDVYRSAPQGAAAPSDATGAIKGVAPYWRVALQKDWDNQSAMIGTFGMRTSLYPGTLSGPRDTYSDIGIDAQLESKVGTGAVVVRGSWIREKQTLDATFGGVELAHLGDDAEDRDAVRAGGDAGLDLTAHRPGIDSSLRVEEGVEDRIDAAEAGARLQRRRVEARCGDHLGRSTSPGVCARTGRVFRPRC